LKKNALLSYRKLCYTAFAEQGMCITMPQSFQPDEKNSIIVRVVDDAILGYDAHSSTTMIPAESTSFNSDEQMKPTRGSPLAVESTMSTHPREDIRPTQQIPPDAIVLSINKPSKRNSTGIVGRESAESFRKKYKNLMDFLQIE